MKIKLLALDMDGTALCDDHVTISTENRDAIEAAIAKGVTVLTATGRVRARVPEQMAEIPGQRYLITSNGAVLTDLLEDQILYTNFFSLKTALQVFDVLDEQEIYMEAYCGGIAYTEQKRLAFVERFPAPPWRRTMMKRGRKIVGDLRGLVQQKGVYLEKMNLPYMPEDVQKEIERKLNRVEGILLTSSVKHNIEINSATASKAGALSSLCKHLGISPEEIMVMGDGGNDISMLEFSGISVAPANAGEDVKQAATHVTQATNNEHAVAEAIRQFIL